MKFALCELLLFAMSTCAAQQAVLPAPKPSFVVTESKTISVDELQQRTQSRARNTFADAKMAAKQGDHLHAIELFDKVLKRDPLFSDARNDLAVELIVVGQTARAEDELQHAVYYDPHFLMGYTNLSVVLCNQKRFSEAEPVIRHALTLSPTSAKGNLLLAIALHGQGKQEVETRDALERAARSSAVAAKLLKSWYGNSEIANASEPNLTDLKTGESKGSDPK